MSRNHQGPGRESVLDELFNTLRGVEDLDELHLFAVSNETVDRYSPELRDWLLQLVNAERGRRETGLEPEYPVVDFFAAWPPVVLVNAMNLSAVIAEASLLVGNPAIQGFAFRLLQLLVGLVGVAYLDLVQRR